MIGVNRLMSSEYSPSITLDNGNGQSGQPGDYGTPSLFESITSVYKQLYPAGQSESDKKIAADLNVTPATASNVGDWRAGLGQFSTFASELAGNITAIWQNPDTGDINVGTGGTTGQPIRELSSAVGGILQQARGLFNLSYPPDDEVVAQPIKTSEGQTGIGGNMGGPQIAALLAMAYIVYKVVA